MDNYQKLSGNGQIGNMRWLEGQYIISLDWESPFADVLCDLAIRPSTNKKGDHYLY